MFTVLHSSAGAGKTHALVKRYLVLALGKKDADTYAGILALTFTNKAAAEMRERVLEYLEALASGKPLEKATEKDVLNEVMAQAGIGADEVHRRAKATLTHMLHHWSQLAVTTIDSFTRRVVMPFTRELQLDQELRMTTEEEYYRAKAIDLMLEEAGDDPALTQVLVATCEQLLEEEKPWRVDAPLLELSKQLGKEEALVHLARLKDMGITRFIEVRDLLRRRTNEFRAQMRALGKKVMDAVEAAGLDEDDFPYKRNGYISFYRDLRDFEEWIEVKQRMAQARSTDNWIAKSTPDYAVKPIEGLVPLLSEVYDEVQARWDEVRRHALDLAILRDLLPTASLNSIDQRLEQLKREEGVSFFSDLTRKVMEIVQEEPAPFLYERLGERYRHFLVDEFQDTSLMQWHALLPLVENALSSEGSVFLVGDAKQAIYRWRNGEVRQFTSFPGLFGKEVLQRGDELERTLLRNHKEVPPLNANYRSAAGIVEFNNALTGSLKLLLDEEERKGYEAHEQELRSSSKGYVEVTAYPTVKAKGRNLDEEEKHQLKQRPWELMIKAVEDSLADGFSTGDIAVLVRSGNQGATASRRLVERGWPVVAPDGFTLGHSPVAMGIVNVLAWLHHRNDETAARAAQSVAVFTANGQDAVDPFAAGKKPRELLDHWSTRHPHVHARQPLVALITKIGLALGCDPAVNGFAMALLNEAHTFAMANGDDLSGFLEHWERTVYKRPAGAAPNPDAIRVMTVHKAKGLQFPVVIIPEAGKAPGGNKRERIWITPGPHVPDLPAALVQQKKTLSDPGMLAVPEAIQENRLSRLDELNVLYVAITRPEQRLYISVPSERGQSLSAGICAFLELSEEQTWISMSVRPRKEEGRKKEVPARPVMNLTPAVDTEEGALAIRREAPEEWDPADPDPFRSHGKAVHAILERVRTAADLPMAIDREAAAWGLPAGEVQWLRDHLGAVLAKPELAPFFGEGLDVYTESTLIDGKGQAWRPDRVVRDGSVFRVLDIKTGKALDDHKEQVRNYTRLLNEVEGCPVEGALLYVREGQVVDVDA